jgi:hypothetical protein
MHMNKKETNKRKPICIQSRWGRTKETEREELEAVQYYSCKDQKKVASNLVPCQRGVLADLTHYEVQSTWWCLSGRPFERSVHG